MKLGDIDEAAIEWWTRFEECKQLNISGRQYCTLHNLNYNQWTNYRYRIYFIEYSDPENYQLYTKAAKEYMESDEKLSVFCARYNLVPRNISEAATHLRYLKVIEDHKRNLGVPNEAMNFFKVPTIIKPSQPEVNQSEPEQEVLEKQNDIEIIINKGVKVSIAPNIDSMKIIKIIELLKDL